LSAEARTHVVQSGETLALVAATEHVSVADLARYNQWEGPGAAHLIVGQVLALDRTSAAALPPPAAAPAAALAELLTVETTSNPSAGSDLAMWNAAGKPRAPRTESGSPVHRFASRILRRASTIAVSLTRSAMRFIGTPYVFGGTSALGFDCSGYVQHVFAMLGIHLPRTADAQYYAGASTHGRLVAGDLVFFQTYEPGPSHVGIYLGNGHFVHSSSSRGVMVSSLSDAYWAARYIGGRRYAATTRAALVTKTFAAD
jgi:cell wall-associated NlpC family hydrolase